MYYKHKFNLLFCNTNKWPVNLGKSFIINVLYRIWTFVYKSHIITCGQKTDVSFPIIPYLI
jgi:hypothetical protein